MFQSKKVFKTVFCFLTSEPAVYRIFLADERMFEGRPRSLLSECSVAPFRFLSPPPPTALADNLIYSLFCDIFYF